MQTETNNIAAVALNEAGAVNAITGETVDAAIIDAANVAAPVVVKPKRVAKPKADKPVAAKPATPAKPDAAAIAADQRSKLVGAARAFVSTIYNGPSLSIRRSERVVTASVYADLLANPKHRTTIAKLTERDESALLAIVKHSDKAGTFDPPAFNCDRGNFSRLASVGYIASAPGGRFKLTSTGIEASKLATKRRRAA